MQYPTDLQTLCAAYLTAQQSVTFEFTTNYNEDREELEKLRKHLEETFNVTLPGGQS